MTQNKLKIPQNLKKGKLVVILGPTASGKTDLAIKLAKKFGGEVVCADSRQIYSEMAIGTASPFLQNKKCPEQIASQLYGADNSKLKIIKISGIPHHLFHIVSPKKDFNVVQYQKLAVKTIKNIQKREKIPFLVGGSAFYIYSVVEGWQFPKMRVDQKLRQRLEKKSVKELSQILKKIDPERAKNIDEKNKRRLVRAIEIAKTLGKVPALQKKPQFNCLLLGRKISEKELKERISQRVEKMIEQGLEKEVRGLVAQYGFTSVLRETIGYAEWLSCGKELNSFPGRSLTPFVPLVAKTIKQNTWKFAKRQMTWFKKDKRIKWVKNYQEAERFMLWITKCDLAGRGPS